MIYAYYSTDDDSTSGGSDSEKEPVQKKDPTADIPRHKELGWPLIPRRGNMTLQQSKSVIRTYVTTIYRKQLLYIFFSFSSRLAGQFTRNKHASVPWKTLGQDRNHSYISSDSLPSGVLLLDPSKLQLLNVSDLWNHWSRRQKDNVQGLVFINARQEDFRFDRDSGPGPSKQPGITYLNPGDLEEDDSINDSLVVVHLESPISHAASDESKASFLRSLADHPVYNEFVGLLNSREAVSVCSHSI